MGFERVRLDVRKNCQSTEDEYEMAYARPETDGAIFILKNRYDNFIGGEETTRAYQHEVH